MSAGNYCAVQGASDGIIGARVIELTYVVWEKGVWNIGESIP